MKVMTALTVDEMIALAKTQESLAVLMTDDRYENLARAAIYIWGQAYQQYVDNGHDMSAGKAYGVLQMVLTTAFKGVFEEGLQVGVGAGAEPLLVRLERHQ